MSPRSFLALSISLIVLSPAFGGIVSQENSASAPISKQQSPDDSGSAQRSNPDQPSHDITAKDKSLLNRLVAELQRSSRSFVYLRSVGFTESDREFEQLIAKNNEVFRSVRIIRRDEQGNRQIPGWPGIALNATYKKQ